MATKKYYLGSIGPYYYDDATSVDDPDGDFSGEDQGGFVSDGAIKTNDLTLYSLTASQVVLSNVNKKLVSRAIGIADDNILEVDGSPSDNDYAKFTANGLEGRSYSELLVDLDSSLGSAFLDGSGYFERGGSDDMQPITGLAAFDLYYDLDANSDIQPRDPIFTYDSNGDIELSAA